jgi:hypothetical protein
VVVLCWLALDVIALAILVAGREYSRVREIGRGLLRFGSTAIMALPGVVLAGILVETMNLLPMQTLLNLCLHLE